MRLRSVLSLALLFALFGLGAILASTLGRFVIPGPEWVEIGRLADFLPADHPYSVTAPIHVFVVCDGERIIALNPLNRVSGGMRVQWIAQESVFRDSSRGTNFDLYGRPVPHPRIQGRVDPQGLERYPVKLEGDRVLVDVSSRATAFVVVGP